MNSKTKIPIILVLNVLLLITSPVISLANVVKSNCVITAIGTPPVNMTMPSECGSGTGTWPFADKSATQPNRVDQGWDMQNNDANAKVYAVASGTVSMNHGPDPCGFGPYYPLIHLDTPITVNGRTYTDMYYGHV